MHAAPGIQKQLLKLSDLEKSLRLNLAEVKALTSGDLLRELADEHRKAGELMLTAQKRYEDLEVEIARILTDIELVDARMDKDRDRLAHSSNPKDIAGVQSELVALETRKSVLETNELELMETRDAAGFEVSEAKALRGELAEKISKIESDAAMQLSKLQSQGSIIEQDIRSLRAQLPEELLAAYERKAKRGNPVGELHELDCGACGLALTASAAADVKATAEDQLPTCPNCEAFLVR